MATGSPILDGTAGHVDCLLVAAHEAGDHVIFVGEVLALAVDPDVTPLLFHHGRYRYLRDIPRLFEAFAVRDDRFDEFTEGFLRVNQIGGFARAQFTKQWAATYAGNFSFENSLSLTHQFGLEYLSKCRCWAVRFELQEDRVRGVSWSLNYRLLGLGDDRDQPFRAGGNRRFDAVRGL